MNPFDMGALGGMIQGMQQRAMEMKQRLAQTQVEGRAGGLVAVTMTCDNRIVSVDIAEEALANQDQLEELVQQALQDALDQVQKQIADGMRDLTGGLPLPPGLIPGT